MICVQAGSRTIDLDLTTLSSTHHVELNPSDAGFQDRYIVQEIIKEMAKNRPIDTKGKKGYKGNSDDSTGALLEFVLSATNITYIFMFVSTYYYYYYYY